MQPQTTDTSEDKKLWIIAAVLGPVVLVILVVLVVCLLVRHSQQRREKGQTDHNEPHLLTVKHGPVSSNRFECVYLSLCRPISFPRFIALPLASKGAHSTGINKGWRKGKHAVTGGYRPGVDFCNHLTISCLRACVCGLMLNIHTSVWAYVYTRTCPHMHIDVCTCMHDAPILF